MQLFALVTCAIIDAEDRARDATQYRGTPGGHTLPNDIFGELDTPRLSFAARGNLTE